MKNSTLEEILTQETKVHPINPNNSFLHNLARNRLPLWIFHRLKWPLLTTTYLSIIYYLLWKEVLVHFPLFDWGDIFFYMQMFFASGFILNAATETLKAELRGYHSKNEEALLHLRNKLAPPILFLALIPFLWIGLSLLPKLTQEHVYLGTYNFILILLSLRLITQIYFRLALTPYSASRRLPIHFAQWFLPALISYAWYHFSSHEPKALVQALFFEWILSTLFQFIRIKTFFPELSLNLLSHLSWKLPFSFILKALDRLPATLPILAMHGALGAYFLQNREIGEKALILHAITPLLSLWVRSPSFFWKEILRDDTLGLQRIFEVIGLFSMLTLTLLDQDPFYLTLSLLFWCEVRFTKYWLKGNIKKAPVDAIFISICLFFPVEYTHQFLLMALALISTLVRLHQFMGQKNENASRLSLTMRRSFWPSHRSREALSELVNLGFDYEIDGRKLLIPASGDQIPKILNWGRGWIVGHETVQSQAKMIPFNPIAAFDLTWSYWKKSLPRELPLEEGVLITRSILRSHSANRLSGKIRIGQKNFFWVRIGNFIYLSSKKE